MCAQLHPTSATSASVQVQQDEEEEQDKKQPAIEGVVADEDQDSEPSSDGIWSQMW